MTSQTRYYIEPSDITALRFECKTCQAVLALPVTADTSRTLLRCPQCGKGWLQLEYSSNAVLIQELAQQIRMVASKAADIGFKFSLEISCDPASSAAD